MRPGRHTGRRFRQLALPTGALGLKVAEGLGERLSAAIVESAHNRAVNCEPDPSARLASEASYSFGDVAKGEHCASVRAAGAAAGLSLEVADLGLEQVGLAVKLAAVPVRVARHTIHDPHVAATG